MQRRHLVSLLKRTQAPDGGTSLTETFPDVGQRWASIGGVAGVVQIGTVQIEDGVTHRLVMRWADPTTFTHLGTRGGGERYRVRGTRDPDGKRRWLEVMAEKESSEAA